MSFLDYYDPLHTTSLYVHIPLCLKKCAYCDFYSVKSDSDLASAFTKKLSEELIHVVDYFHKPFYTVYFGGGSPSILSIKQLEDLCSIICKYGKPEEFTIEVNPEHLNYDFVFLFSEYFNRLSMGVQSLSAAVLKTLGRNATLETTLKALEISQNIKEKTGIKLSYDFITCVRGMNSHPLSDLEFLINCFPVNHLSVYSLTPSENAPLFKNGRYRELTEKTQAEMLKKTWLYLKENNFRHYEVSNFAKNNEVSKHNMVYWNYEQFVGIGPSASGTSFRNDNVFRITGRADIKAYINGNILTEYDIESLTSEQQCEELIMLGSRTDSGINLDRLQSEFGYEITKIPDYYKKINNCIVPDGDLGFLFSDSALKTMLFNMDKSSYL